MRKTLYVFVACAFLIVACSSDPGSDDNLLSTMPTLSDQVEVSDSESKIDYNLLYNPDNLSPTEYILANCIKVEVAQRILDNDPDFSPDTVFGWNYKVTDQIIPEAGDHMRKVSMPDGTVNSGTYDFSPLNGKDFISIFADGGLLVASSWGPAPAAADSACICVCDP